MLDISHFGFEVGMWVPIVQVPELCILVTLTARSNFVTLAFRLQKVRTMDFSETILPITYMLMDAD